MVIPVEISVSLVLYLHRIGMNMTMEDFYLVMEVFELMWETPC